MIIIHIQKIINRIFLEYFKTHLVHKNSKLIFKNLVICYLLGLTPIGFLQ